MKSELTPRQWALYNLLKNNPGKRFTQAEIAYSLKEYYTLPVVNLNFHDSAARLAITDDIRAINNSDVIQKIIISDRNGVRLANKEEFEKYIKGQFSAIFRKLERTRKKAKKGGLNGQMRMTFGRERDTVEAFTDGISRLKAARLNKNLKLADVVRELRKTEKGIDISLLSKMENGYCKPTDRVLLKLADIYAVEASELSDDKIYALDVLA